eukprot:jgi/Undpi1/5591/HiC_scaffold_2.g00867.m1
MDLTDLAIQPGKVHLVREILHNGVTGSVRVLGSISSYDAAADVAVIEYKGEELNIDASLLPGFQFQTGSLYEFIGEIESASGGKTVKARVCRNVDGLDTHLFEKALEVRRKFLADPAYQPSSSMDVSPEPEGTGRQPPPPTPEKVKVHFKPIANAPILRKGKFQVNSSWTCLELQASLRNMLHISDATPLFLYCNSAFEPSPDQSLSDLYKCFHVNKELLMSYSITEAWV